MLQRMVRQRTNATTTNECYDNERMLQQMTATTKDCYNEQCYNERMLQQRTNATTTNECYDNE